MRCNCSTRANTFFVSRPRRFGKSLFLDTLKELFEGNLVLFDGMHAKEYWDWSVPYPVIRLSFGRGVLKYTEALGLHVHGEDVTNHGRIDLSLKCDQLIYLFEFKVIADTELPEQPEQSSPHSPALQQLIDRGYVEKYRAPGVTITLIGITFSKAERKVSAVDAKQLTDDNSTAIVGWETAQA